MRRLLYIIIGAIAFSLAITSCEDKALNRQLSDLDTLMRVRPDSVYAVLNSMDTRSMSKSQRMYHALLLADAQNKAYIDFTTDSVMLAVADYYDNHGTPNEQMRAHYLLGCTYRDLGDAPMELQCFLDATEKADTTREDCDLYTLVAIYGQMADIYNEQFLPHEELKALSMCEKIAKKDNDNLTAIGAQELRARAFFLTGELDSVAIITEKTYNDYLNLNNKQKASRALCSYIGLLVDAKQYDKADSLMCIYERYGNIYEQDGRLKDDKALYYYPLGMMSIHKNNFLSAQNCCYNLKEVGETEAAYKGLLALYEKTNKTDSIAKYAKLYASANDSSYININSKFIEQMTASYNYSRQERIAKKNLLEKKKEKENNLTLIIILISVLFTSATLAYSAFTYHKRVRREHIRKEGILYRRYNNTIEKIESLERERSKLVTLQATNEDNLQQLKEEIERYRAEKEELVKKLEHLGNPKKEIDFVACMERFKHNPTIEILWEKLIKVKPGDSTPISPIVWNNVQKHFQKQFPKFVKLINDPINELNDMDRKTIMLNICDFSTSDIALLLGKSIQQISNTHSRIRTKLYPKLKNTHHLKREILSTLRATL